MGNNNNVLPTELNGLFKYFGIENLWDICTEEERNDLVKMSDDYFTNEYGDGTDDYDESFDEEEEDDEDDEPAPNPNKKMPVKVDIKEYFKSRGFTDEEFDHMKSSASSNQEAENRGTISLFEGDVKYTDYTKITLLAQLRSHAIKIENESLTEKLKNICDEEALKSTDYLDVHYYYTDMGEYYRKLSKTEPNTINIAIDYFKKTLIYFRNICQN